MWRWPVAAVWRVTPQSGRRDGGATVGPPDVKWEKQYSTQDVALACGRCLAGVTPQSGRRDGGATVGNGCERNNIAMLGQHKAILVMTLLYLPLPI
jgi:hypothetical protein